MRIKRTKKGKEDGDEEFLSANYYIRRGDEERGVQEFRGEVGRRGNRRWREWQRRRGEKLELVLRRRVLFARLRGL